MPKNYINDCLKAFRQLLLATFLVFGTYSVSYGQSQEYSFSKKNSRLVLKAMKKQQSGEHEKALKQYYKLLKSVDLNPYEMSTIYQLIGHIHYDLDAYKPAMGHFQKAIDINGLPEYQAESLKDIIKKIEVITNENYIPPNSPEKPKSHFKINPRPIK